MADLALKVSGLTKSYGNKVVLDDLSFTASMNDFSVICGKPGNGKSVLVRTIMGLEPVDSGSIIVRGQDVAKASAEIETLAMCHKALLFILTIQF